MWGSVAAADKPAPVKADPATKPPVTAKSEAAVARARPLSLFEGPGGHAPWRALEGPRGHAP